MASNEEIKNQAMREFSTGATRNIDQERIDPEGFFSPQVIMSFCEYMHKNRVQKDGQLRESDNWQRGIPQSAYMKSLWRHFLNLWTNHRAAGNNRPEQSPYRNEQIVEDLQALMFNTMGYLSEELKKPSKDSLIPVICLNSPQIVPGSFKPITAGRDYTGLLNKECKDRVQLLEDCCNETGYGSGV